MRAPPELQVTDNRDESRYEAHLDGELAGWIVYEEQPGGIVLIHTQVVDEFEGRGVGGRLVAGALDDIRARGLQVTPRCTFAAGYIERNPEHADLVAT
jgi:predicted GNAT family acetyltransferase